MRINKFTRQYGGVYDCEVCGRATRETGDGESMAELCARCYREAVFVLRRHMREHRS